MCVREEGREREREREKQREKREREEGGGGGEREREREREKETLSKALRDGRRSKPGLEVRTLSRLPETISVPTRSQSVVTSATAPLLLTWWVSSE